MTNQMISSQSYSPPIQTLPLDRLSELTAGLVGPPGPPGRGRVGKTGKSGPRGPIGATFSLSMTGFLLCSCVFPRLSFATFSTSMEGLLLCFCVFLLPDLLFFACCFVLTFRRVVRPDCRTERSARTCRDLQARTTWHNRTQRLPG